MFTLRPRRVSRPARHLRSRSAWRELAPLERLEQRSVLSVAPVGGQFLVNEVLSPSDVTTAVAIVADSGPSAGRYVAVWQSYGADGDGYGIVARAFERDGKPVAGSAETIVDLPLSGGVGLGNQIAPGVSSDGDGRIVIAWQSESRNGGGYDVFYRAGTVTDAGLVLGDQSVANIGNAGDQTAPAVAMDSKGDFVVAWQTPGATAADGLDVVFRRGDFAGGLSGPEMNPVTAPTGDQTGPSVAMNSHGDLVVAWRGAAAAASAEEEAAGAIFLRGFAPDGAPTPSEVRASEGSYHDLGAADVAIDTAGRVALVWQVEGQQGSGSDVFGRRFSFNAATGVIAPVVTADAGTGDFRLNETTTGPQRAPAVGIAANGDMLAAWQTQHQDGFSWAIFGRAYAAGSDGFTAEFLVNSGTQLGPQTGPDVAMDQTGRTVIAWVGPDVPTGSEEGEGGHAPAIHARSFADAGRSPDGDEVVLANYAGVEDAASATAADAAGNMILVWQSWEAPGDDSDFGIYAKFIQSDGRWLDVNENGLDDDAMLVNTFTAGSQSRPAVASDAAGNFVVAWESVGQDGSGSGIYARRYDASRKDWADAAEFLVNATTAGDQTAPAVASDGRGGFTVVWQGPDAEGTGIYRRRYAAAGNALEGDVRVNVVTAYDQVAPAIGMNDAGEAVVTWVSDHNVANDPNDSEKSVFARWYAATGVPLGAQEFLVNKYVKDAQESPSVDLAADGSFVIAWQSINQERLAEDVGSSWGVYARRFTVNKTAGTVQSPQSEEFRVNETTDGPQRFASVGVDDSGRFSVAWQSIRQDGSSWAVLSRNYNADASAAGAETIVNSFTNGPQILPVIAQRGAGDLTVFWSGPGTGQVEGVSGQRYRFIRDDFNRGNLPTLGGDWTVTIGGFEVRSNQAVIRASVGGLGLLRTARPTDVAVEARVTVGSGTKTAAGLVARSSESSYPTFYWGGFRRQGNGFIAEIGRAVNGVWNSLVSVPQPTGQGQLRFEVLGESLKLFVDGRLAVATNDKTITSAGRVGMQGAFEAAYDDFTYATLQRPAARLPFSDLFNGTDGTSISRLWTERQGGIMVQSYQIKPIANVNLATVNAPAVRDVVVTATVRVSAVSAVSGVASRINAAGTNMYWGGLVNRGGTLAAEIWLILGGVPRRIAWTTLTQPTATNHVIRFSATGSSLALHVDGALAVQTLDATIASAGSVGMRVSANGRMTRFDVG